MQTFLPYADFDDCAAVLDDRRLGKQRVEALQVMRALTIERYGWKSHPVVLMWTGYEEALAAYGTAICREWCRRGYADTCALKIQADARAGGVPIIRTQAELAAAGRLPPWLGDEAVHRSHDRPWFARTRATTGITSPTCPTTSPTNGRCVSSRGRIGGRPRRQRRQRNLRPSPAHRPPP